MKPYHPLVAALIKGKQAQVILDAPCGSGWLAKVLTCEIDGIDLFAPRPQGYRNFLRADLDAGLPETLGTYDAIVSCEGIEHVGNPRAFLSSARQRLKPGGMLIVTTPNTWHPAARLQYLLRGFFPGFPCLIGNIAQGAHMHITPWSFPHLALYLRLCGFYEIRLHDVDEPKPKRAYEWVLGAPQLLYCRHKHGSACSDEERTFWRDAGSRQSVFGRRLVVSAIAPTLAI